MLGKRIGNNLLNKKVVVGYDSRLTSLPLVNSLFLGLLETGCDIVNIGMCSTPMVNFAHKYFFTEAAIMVTASHNPNEYNGFKIIKNNVPLSATEMSVILSDVAERYSINFNFSTKETSVLSQYIDHITSKNLLYRCNRRLKIIWDAGGCTAGIVINSLVKCFPQHEHVIINDVINPVGYADNSNIENLVKLTDAVSDHGADIGFYFDTDADRISVVRAGLGIISIDSVMMMLLTDMVIKNMMYNGVILDYKTSNKVIDYLRKNNINILFCRTGHSFIRKAIIESNACFAGESSGHIFFGENGYDDGIYAAVKIINILGEYDPFYDLPPIYITHDIRIDVVQKQECIVGVKNRLIADNIHFLDINDGIKVILKNGWWVIRESGTEDKVVIRLEADDEKSLHSIKLHLKNYFFHPDLDFFL